MSARTNWGIQQPVTKRDQEELVSIVMPCYNSGRWINKTLYSLINQTYKNLEIILVDDGSVDNTFTMLKDFASKDERVKVYKNKTNLGIAETRNLGLKHIKGTYYAPCDHDDISDITRIEKQVRFLQNNPDFAAVGCQIITIDENENQKYIRKYPTTHNDVIKTLTVTSPICNPASLIRCEHFRNIGFYYNETVSGVEDYDIWFRLAEKYKLGNLSEFLYYYRTTYFQQTARKTKHILIKSQNVQRKWLFKKQFYRHKSLLLHLIRYALLLLPNKLILGLNKKLTYTTISDGNSTNLNVVFFPAEYSFSPNSGSKPSWCYHYIEALAKRKNIQISVFCENASGMCSTENVKVFHKGHRFNPKPKIPEVMQFQLWLLIQCIKNRELLKKADVIHHFGNFGNRTSFNIPLLTGLIDKRKFVVGPLEEAVNPFYGHSWISKTETRVIHVFYELFLKNLVRATLRKSATVLYQSEYAKAHYEKLYTNQNCRIINPGITINPNIIGNSKNLSSPTILVTICSLTPLKRVSMMLEILKALSLKHNVKMTIIGDGEEREKLEEKARTLQIENFVDFTGKFENDIALERLRACHIYINCSLYESFGQAMLEASLCGLPVVASTTPGASIILENGVTGFLIPQNDEEIDRFCDCISKIIEIKGLYEAMSKASIGRTVNHFDWEIIAEKYIDIYSKIKKRSGVVRVAR